MSNKPLYFLTHEGNPAMFSGYGIPLKEGEKCPLVGMLMMDRPNRYPEEYLQGLRDTFGEVMLGPMTSKGNCGIFARMRIEEPLSLSLLRDDLYGYKAEQIAAALELGLNN